MDDRERFYRLLSASELEKLAESMPDPERPLIEEELRRRELTESAVNVPTRKPRYRTAAGAKPAWWKHRTSVFLLIYAVPFLAVEIWGYLHWKRYLDSFRFDHLDPLELTAESLYMPFVAIQREGAFSLIAVLLAIAAYAVHPRPTTALVSLLATALWCFLGHSILAIGF